MLLNMSHYININVCTKPRRSPRGLCTDEGHLCSVPPYREECKIRKPGWLIRDSKYKIQISRFYISKFTNQIIDLKTCILGKVKNVVWGKILGLYKLN